MTEIKQGFMLIRQTRSSVINYYVNTEMLILTPICSVHN